MRIPRIWPAMVGLLALFLSVYALADGSGADATRRKVAKVLKQVADDVNDPTLNPLERLGHSIDFVGDWLSKDPQNAEAYQLALKELKDQKEKLQSTVNVAADILYKYQCELVVREPKPSENAQPIFKTIKLDGDDFRSNAGMQLVEQDNGEFQMVPSMPKKSPKASLNIVFFYSTKEDGSRPVIAANGGEIIDLKAIDAKGNSDASKTQRSFVPMVAQLKAPTLANASLQLFGPINEYHINCK